MIATDDIKVRGSYRMWRGTWTTGLFKIHIGPVTRIGWFTVNLIVEAT